MVAQALVSLQEEAAKRGEGLDHSLPPSTVVKARSCALVSSSAVQPVPASRNNLRSEV